jgi:2-hydroxycyclohexanecarboxyl-CoA dehydrogenase
MSDPTSTTDDAARPDPRRFLDMTGRVALVTGAGRGVGAEIARYLAAFGAEVVVNDYKLERAERTAAAITEEGGTALALQGDVTDFASVTSMVEAATAQLGTVDILVNNAGNAGADPQGLTGAPFWKADPSEWQPYLDVNLLGVMHMCRAVIPGMIEGGKGGRLLTIISDAGRVGEAGLEAYSAAKAGAAGLMRALARSLGRYGITANSIAIATTNTPAVARAIQNEDWAKKALRNYVIRRFGEPSDVAAVATLLASPASGWITGQTYPVNGGFSVNQ